MRLRTVARLLLALALLASLFLVPAQRALAQPAECNDAIDNDGDGFTDYAEDPGCVSPDDNREGGECQDGVDNDGDTYTDYPDDPQCATPEHGDEACPPNTICDRFTSNVTIRFDVETREFRGMIGVPRPECKAGKEVVITRVQRGPDEAVGSVLTNRRGRYRLETFGRVRGRFQARVPEQQTRSRSGESYFMCPGDRSVIIKI